MKSYFCIRVLQGDVAVEDQVYSIHNCDKGFEVQGASNSLIYPDARCTSVLNVRPRHYSTAQIVLHRGGVRREIDIRMCDDRTAQLTVDGIAMTGSQWDRENDVHFLLDGPNPMFDFINTIMMLGVCEGDRLRVPVHVIDWRAGALIRTEYLFSRTGYVVHIQKGLDPHDDSRVIIDPDLLGLIGYQTAGYVYMLQD